MTTISTREEALREVLRLEAAGKLNELPLHLKMVFSDSLVAILDWYNERQQSAKTIRTDTSVSDR